MWPVSTSLTTKLYGCRQGAGEDDVIHLPSGLDRVDCERQEEEEEKKSLTTLEVMTYYLVVHTGPDGLIWPTLSSHWFVIIVIYHNDKDNDTERRNSKICIFSSLGHELSPTPTLNWPGPNRVKITCSTSGDHQVRHAVCQVVGKDSSAIKFDRVEIAGFLFCFILFYFVVVVVVLFVLFCFVFKLYLIG